jgi:hypothetical protein
MLLGQGVRPHTEFHFLSNLFLYVRDCTYEQLHSALKITKATIFLCDFDALCDLKFMNIRIFCLVYPLLKYEEHTPRHNVVQGNGLLLASQTMRSKLQDTQYFHPLDASSSPRHLWWYPRLPLRPQGVLP